MRLIRRSRSTGLPAFLNCVVLIYNHCHDRFKKHPFLNVCNDLFHISPAPQTLRR
jgi:hypothetical protein